MNLFRDFIWKTRYSPDDGNLLEVFYLPVLKCAVRYDRTTGFFKPDALAKASEGVEELVRNSGKMRLIVGCTLEQAEVEAIQRGENLRNTVEASLSRSPLEAHNGRELDALELLAWMVANNYLDIKLAIPFDRTRNQPCADFALFHEKAGILTDAGGDRLVFHGSLNETGTGWMRNWETFHVYCSWKDDVAHLNEEEQSFQRLWDNRQGRAMVLELGEAVQKDLLRFLPEGQREPRRLNRNKNFLVPVLEDLPEETILPVEISSIEEKEFATIDYPNPDKDDCATIWQFIYKAAQKAGGGDYVGEATSAVQAWPHQIRTFERMYKKWPTRLLLADEVGLGKTIEAGLLIRQAWLAGKAKRILILAPKALLRQWQIELREKFNLNFPIYANGQLQWYPSLALRGKDKCKVDDTQWFKRPLLLLSSHMMQRKERVQQLLKDAEPWDLLILDEAHHARRQGQDLTDRPNRLLATMRGLQKKTKALLLMTATPMQLHPIEIWDLLDLLGLPSNWDSDSFLKFFHLATQYAPASKTVPSNEELLFMWRLFKSMEKMYEPLSKEKSANYVPNKLQANKVWNALHDESVNRLYNLNAEERRVAVALMRVQSPINKLIARHTRDLLRRYLAEGKLTVQIAERQIEDYFVPLNPQERALYEQTEDHISTTYNNAEKKERTAIGFVMTIYRRRLASSFDALEQTLQHRLDALNGAESTENFNSEDLSDDETQDNLSNEETVVSLEKQSLKPNESLGIQALLASLKALQQMESKALSLLKILPNLRQAGYDQVIIFTQYTDTLDSLRKIIGQIEGEQKIICFSGRGGEQWRSGKWEKISRETTKELFREGKAEILLCTDAAAEGLNLQTCGALINYDMPWNPMKVEQRIGRIDRLGQKFPVIRIINLMYEDTVETDVYKILRDRINLFRTFVGKNQPILSNLPKAFSEVTLSNKQTRKSAGQQMVVSLEKKIEEQAKTGLDLEIADKEDFTWSPHPTPAYDLAYLNKVLTSARLLPPGYVAKVLTGGKDYAYFIPGRGEPIRVTTDPEFYEEHAESVELWSIGSPVFPKPS